MTQGGERSRFGWQISQCPERHLVPLDVYFQEEGQAEDEMQEVSGSAGLSALASVSREVNHAQGQGLGETGLG